MQTPSGNIWDSRSPGVPVPLSPSVEPTGLVVVRDPSPARPPPTFDLKRGLGSFPVGQVAQARLSVVRGAGIRAVVGVPVVEGPFSVDGDEPQSSPSPPPPLPTSQRNVWEYR